MLILEWRQSSPDRKIGLVVRRENRHEEDWQEAERGAKRSRTDAISVSGLAREALWDTVILSGFGFVQKEGEAERTALCGARYAHQEQRQAVRAGHVPSSLVLGGRRVEIQRPRVRSSDGHELGLPSWPAWSSRDPLDERAFEQMVVGVSTRRYPRSQEPLPQEVAVAASARAR